MCRAPCETREPVGWPVRTIDPNPFPFPRTLLTWNQREVGVKMRLCLNHLYLTHPLSSQKIGKAMCKSMSMCLHVHMRRVSMWVQTWGAHVQHVQHVKNVRSHISWPKTYSSQLNMCSTQAWYACIGACMWLEDAAIRLHAWLMMWTAADHMQSYDAAMLLSCIMQLSYSLTMW